MPNFQSCFSIRFGSPKSKKRGYADFVSRCNSSGNRTQLIDTPLDLAEQIVWDYSYDWLNRLSSVTRSRPEASPAVDDIVTVYGYDESDNRTEFTYTEGSNPSIETSYSYNAADEIQERMVASVVVETFSHDKDGNMLTRDNGSSTITYGWDHFDRLVSFRQTDPPKRQRYRYDTGNIRTSKSENDGAKTEFKYGGMAVANEARTPSGGSPTATAWFGGHQLLGFERGGSFYYLLADGLSSVRTIVTAAGSVAASYNSDEFGNPIQATETSTSSPSRYVGALGVRDEVGESGLHYMRQRYYDPTVGRFVTTDPIGVEGGLNLYGYARNDPANHSDPLGLMADSLHPSILAAIASGNINTIIAVLNDFAMRSPAALRLLPLFERARFTLYSWFGAANNLASKAGTDCITIAKRLGDQLQWLTQLGVRIQYLHIEAETSFLRFGGDRGTIIARAVVGGARHVALVLNNTVYDKYTILFPRKVDENSISKSPC